MNQNTNTKKPVFILFEGLDGCGKSVISKIVAEKIGFTWVNTLNGYFQAQRKIVDNTFKNNGAASQMFYTLANVSSSNYVTILLKNEFPVIMDRYMPTTIAYDTIVRNSGHSDEFWIENFFYDISVPDLTIYLEVSPEIRKKRMENHQDKNITSDDKKSIEYHEILKNRYDKIFTMLQSKTKNPWNIVKISNEDTEKECIDKCVKEILKLYNN